jgi:hypothetical protein
MTAEGNLSNPALFDHDGTQGRAYLEAAPAALRTALEAVPAPAPGTSLGDYSFPDSIWTCRRYLAIVECLKTATASSAIRAHLFKLLHAYFEDPRFQDMRSRLAMCGSTLADFKGFLDELGALVEVRHLAERRTLQTLSAAGKPTNDCCTSLSRPTTIGHQAATGQVPAQRLPAPLSQGNASRCNRRDSDRQQTVSGAPSRSAARQETSNGAQALCHSCLHKAGRGQVLSVRLQRLLCAIGRGIAGCLRAARGQGEQSGGEAGIQGGQAESEEGWWSSCGTTGLITMHGCGARGAPFRRS